MTDAFAATDVYVHTYEGKVKGRHCFLVVRICDVFHPCCTSRADFRCIDAVVDTVISVLVQDALVRCDTAAERLSVRKHFERPSVADCACW